VASIVALGKAAELAKQNLDQNSYANVGDLRDKLEAALLESITNSMVNGETEHRLPNTTSIAFEYVEGEAILLLMNDGRGNRFRDRKDAAHYPSPARTVAVLEARI